MPVGSLVARLVVKTLVAATAAINQQQPSVGQQ